MIVTVKSFNKVRKRVDVNFYYQDLKNGGNIKILDIDLSEGNFLLHKIRTFLMLTIEGKDPQEFVLNCFKNFNYPDILVNVDKFIRANYVCKKYYVIQMGFNYSIVNEESKIVGQVTNLKYLPVIKECFDWETGIVGLQWSGLDVEFLKVDVD